MCSDPSQVAAACSVLVVHPFEASDPAQVAAAYSVLVVKNMNAAVNALSLDFNNNNRT